MREYKDHGNELCFDYEHKAVDDDARAGDGKAAGWFNLELRADGLYAVNIRWTPQAAQQLGDKEWRYFSPAFEIDLKTKRITKLTNVALTNIPATKRMTPLVAASQGPMKTKTKKTTEEETVDDGVEAEEETTEEECDEDVDADEGEDVDAADGEDEDEDEDSGPPAPPPPPPPAKKKAKKLSIAAAAREITGKVNSSEIIGSLRALRASHDRVVELSARLEKVERRSAVTTVRTMVEQAIKAGKLVPAQREAFTKIGVRDRLELKGLIDTMPAMRLSRSSEPGQSIKGVRLSNDEIKIARALGTLEGYAARKAANELRTGNEEQE